jgi:hypothetical protein
MRRSTMMMNMGQEITEGSFLKTFTTFQMGLRKGFTIHLQTALVIVDTHPDGLGS